MCLQVSKDKCRARQWLMRTGFKFFIVYDWIFWRFFLGIICRSSFVFRVGSGGPREPRVKNKPRPACPAPPCPALPSSVQPTVMPDEPSSGGDFPAVRRGDSDREGQRGGWLLLWQETKGYLSCRRCRIGAVAAAAAAATVSGSSRRVSHTQRTIRRRSYLAMIILLLLPSRIVFTRHLACSWACSSD